MAVHGGHCVTANGGALNNSKRENDQTSVHHESAHQNDYRNCTFRARKVEGTTKKFFSALCTRPGPPPPTFKYFPAPLHVTRNWVSCANCHILLLAAIGFSIWHMTHMLRRWQNTAISGHQVLHDTSGQILTVQSNQFCAVQNDDVLIDSQENQRKSLEKCCRQLSNFKADMRQIRLRFGLCPETRLGSAPQTP